jgi:hypothetical protein
MNIDPNNLDMDKHAKYLAEIAYYEMTGAHDFAYAIGRGDEKAEREAELEFMLDVVGPNHSEIGQYLELARVIGIDEAKEYARSVRSKAETEVETLWQEKNGLDRCYECNEFFEEDELSNHPDVGTLCEDCVLQYDEEDE